MDFHLNYGSKMRTTRADGIIRSLRRRDNLGYFVDGLAETEIFPYPDGEKDPIPKACLAYEEVTVCPERWPEVLKFSLQDVQASRLSNKELTNTTICLCPESGHGAYTEDNDPISTAPSKLHRADILTQKDMERIRSAMWGRHDWILEKVAFINELREAVEEGDRDDDDPYFARGEDNELEEEVDHRDESECPDGEADSEDEGDPTKDKLPKPVAFPINGTPVEYHDGTYRYIAAEVVIPGDEFNRDIFGAAAYSHLKRPATTVFEQSVQASGKRKRRSSSLDRIHRQFTCSPTEEPLVAIKRMMGALVTMLPAAISRPTSRPKFKLAVQNFAQLTTMMDEEVDAEDDAHTPDSTGEENDIASPVL